MIPYLEIPNLQLGPLTVGPFGVFVALGIWLAVSIIYRQSARRGLDPVPLANFSTWAIVGGVLGGHFVHLFLYHPEELRNGPLQILKVWDGLSSFGGLLGGVVAALIYFRRHHLRFGPYADAFALGVAPGWAVARVGCFAVHDHPGVRSNFFLAVQFPGGARHDLGLYDAILLFAISGVLFFVARQGWLKDKLLGLLALLYGIGRFGFDFLRATDLSYVDARYAGLTPAQYGCLLLIVWGIWRLVRAVRWPSGGAPTREAWHAA